METAYKKSEIGELLYRLYYDGRAFLKFLKFIMRKSIYEYYFSLSVVRDEDGKRFSADQLDSIIATIEKNWVKNA